MSCHAIRAMIHDYLDGELPSNQAVALEDHLRSCLGCSEELEDLRWVREHLGKREYLPAAAREYIWRQVQTRGRESLRTWFDHQWESFWTFWRDVDRPAVWSKLSAVPVTLCCFIMIMMQFQMTPVQEWIYPAIAMRQIPSSVFVEPLMTQVQARYTSADINEMMSAAWKIPYEDSLSLVAEVTPEGHAQIDHVLEYPKSNDLLQAVDVTLRTSEFQSLHNLKQPFMIYSFQKIDVYGDHPDL